MTIKDSLDTAGMVSTAGTLGRARFVPEANATVVERVLAAGAILLGKTNTPELTLSFDTDNLVFGPTHNPWDLERSPGGSSGGAAAIVAAGGSPCDLGSDTGGSIRWPAHCCGVCGLRPTSGRVPRTGHVIGFGGPTDSWTTLGPLARTVDDLELLLAIIAGPDGRDPAIVPAPLGHSSRVEVADLRVAFHTDNGIVTPTAEVQDAVRRAAATLARAGARVEEARPPGIEATHEINRAIRTSEGRQWIQRLLAAAGTERHGFKGLDALSGGSAADLASAIDRWDRLRLDFAAFMDHHDVVLAPVAVGPAPARPFDPMAVLPQFSYTQTWSLMGWPVVVVRAGTSPEGLPLGVQVVARPWREDVALAAARQIEREQPKFGPPAI
jgi:amidase